MRARVFVYAHVHGDFSVAVQPYERMVYVTIHSKHVRNTQP